MHVDREPNSPRKLLEDNELNRQSEAVCERLTRSRRVVVGRFNRHWQTMLCMIA